MTEGSAIYQNMSAPPKTTIRYSGLVNLDREEDHVAVSNSKTESNRNYIGLSRPVLFRLPQAVRTTNPRKLLATIAPDTVTKNPEQEILRLIDERAKQLPLPDGVAVVSAAPDCPSSKHLGHLSLFLNGGSGSSRFDVKPLVVDGSSGGFGW